MEPKLNRGTALSLKVSEPVMRRCARCECWLQVLEQLQRRDRGHDLRHRVDADDGVRLHGGAGVEVARAVGPPADDLAVTSDEDGCTGMLAGLHRSFDEFEHALKPVRVHPQSPRAAGGEGVGRGADREGRGDREPEHERPGRAWNSER